MRHICTVAIIALFACGVIEAGRVAIEDYRKIVPKPGANAIVNGDFERDPDGDGMPDEWGRVEHWKPTTRAQVRRVKLPDGNHVLSIKFLTDGGCVVNYLLREKRRYFELTEPTPLYHALRVKHSGRGVVYGHTITSEYGAVGSTTKLGRPGDWRKIGAVYRYDPAQHKGIAMVRIYVRGARAGDEYLIDDYVLRAVDKREADRLRKELFTAQGWRTVPPSEAAKAPSVSKGNILMDSSFESNPGVCAVRYGAKWWARGGKLERGDAVHGEYAVRGSAESDPYTYCDSVPHSLS